jgi:hypothetical protein
MTRSLRLGREAALWQLARATTPLLTTVDEVDGSFMGATLKMNTSAVDADRGGVAAASDRPASSCCELDDDDLQGDREGESGGS